MLRGIKRIIMATGLGAVATLAVPATAAFATVSPATPCPSAQYVDLITSLNYHHCYKGTGSLTVNINDVKVLKSGYYTVTYYFASGSSWHLVPGLSSTLSPSQRVTSISLS